MSAEDLEPLGRLLDDPELGGELRADLLAAQSFQVPFDANAGLARFQAHLDSLPQTPGEAPPPEPSGIGTTGTGTTAATPALQLTGGKILAALALAAGLGFGALELTGGSERKASSAAPVAADEPKLIAPAPKAGNPNPASAPVAPTQPAPLAAAATANAPAVPKVESKKQLALPAPAPEPVLEGAVSAPAPSAAPTLSAADRLAQEVAQLGEIKRTLAADPARALTLADQGHAQFADGALRLEREALALSALEKLGRRDALNQRGEAFLKRYPQSSFSSQVKRMLGR